MREIRFRAWDKKNKHMRNVVGMTFYDDSGDFTDTYVDSVAFQGMEGKELQNWRVDQYSQLMQYTGLKDKNGKEIYEGDIVRVKLGGSKGGFVKEVKWNQGIAAFESLYFNASHLHEVIGNIYENPELLK